MDLLYLPFSLFFFFFFFNIIIHLDANYGSCVVDETGYEFSENWRRMMRRSFLHRLLLKLNLGFG